MSTRVDGATVTVTVSACATLSAGTVHMTLTAREGPVAGIRLDSLVILLGGMTPRAERVVIDE